MIGSSGGIGMGDAPFSPPLYPTLGLIGPPNSVESRRLCPIADYRLIALKTSSSAPVPTIKFAPHAPSAAGTLPSMAMPRPENRIG